MSRWSWEGHTLFAIGPDGARRVPPANEIYRALVERKFSGAFESDPPRGLKISRYPIVPLLELDLDDTGIPVIKLFGRCRGEPKALEMADVNRGHVIVDATWFPIDALAVDEVRGALSGACALPGVVHSLKTFLQIRAITIQGGPVTDRIGDRAVSPLAFAPTDCVEPPVKARLYPYQVDGWRWLRFICSEGVGGILADEMGLGKTLQVIATMADPGNPQPDPTLIVAPSSLLENWRREINRFAPGITVLKHQGADRTGSPAELCRYRAVVASYDTVVHDSGLLGTVQWGMVILDEAQFIRNPDAQRSKAVKRLRRNVGLAVTGTPMENTLLDLWSIVDFVLPGQLGARGDFEKRFTDDRADAKLLEAEVSPFMLRRRVAEVAKDLPPRIDIPQVVELAEQEATEYERIRQRIKDEYGAAATLVSLGVLRMFCAHPNLVDKQQLRDPMQFAKFRRLDEILRETFLKAEKVLVFTSFTSMADMIVAHIRHVYRIYAGVLDGRSPIEDRQPMIDEFSSAAGGAALVLNPRAGGAGLNIAAANHVVHYNPEWNPAMEDQASARAYRRGQVLPVTVHHLFTANTVEEVIRDRLDRKRGVAESAIVGISGRDEDYSDIVAALSKSPSLQFRMESN